MELKGRLQSTIILNGSISSARLVGKISNGNLDGVIYKPSFIDRDAYEGSYDITPITENDIVLETEDKRMTDDVTVRKIPYEEVSNPQGGKTATIGGY